MDGSDVGNGIRVGVFREKEVFDAIQGAIFEEGIEIGCEANKCNFSDIACREFRGVVLILVFRLGIEKVLVLQQAVAAKGCSRGAMGKWRRGMSAQFGVDGEVEVSS